MRVSKILQDVVCSKKLSPEEDTATTTGLDSNNDGGSSPTIMTLFAPTDQAFAHRSESFSNSASSYSKLTNKDGEYNNRMDFFPFHVIAGNCAPNKSYSVVMHYSK